MSLGDVELRRARKCETYEQSRTFCSILSVVNKISATYFQLNTTK